MTWIGSTRDRYVTYFTSKIIIAVTGEAGKIFAIGTLSTIRTGAAETRNRKFAIPPGEASDKSAKAAVVRKV